MTRNHLGTFQVIVRDDGSCTVPPNRRTDGEMCADDCEYPDVQAALMDLYDAVISDEMPVRVTFEFSRSGAEVWEAEPRASRLAAPHQTSVGRRTEEGRALWSGRCVCGWESPAVYGSAGGALNVCQEHVRQAREVAR